MDEGRPGHAMTMVEQVIHGVGKRTGLWWVEGWVLGGGLVRLASHHPEESPSPEAAGLLRSELSQSSYLSSHSGCFHCLLWAGPIAQLLDESRNLFLLGLWSFGWRATQGFLTTWASKSCSHKSQAQAIQMDQES